jgi:hypothetical protein
VQRVDSLNAELRRVGGSPTRRTATAATKATKATRKRATKKATKKQPVV